MNNWQLALALVLGGVIVHEFGHVIAAKCLGYKVGFFIGLPRRPWKRIMLWGRTPIFITPWLIGTGAWVRKARGISAGKYIVISLYGVIAQMLYVLAAAIVAYQKEAWTVISGLLRASFDFDVTKVALLFLKLDLIHLPPIAQARLVEELGKYGFNDIAVVVDRMTNESRVVLFALLVNTFLVFWNLIPVPPFDGGRVVFELLKSGLRPFLKFRIFGGLTKSAK